MFPHRLLYARGNLLTGQGHGIVRQAAQHGVSSAALARHYGVVARLMSPIASGKRWRHLV